MDITNDKKLLIDSIASITHDSSVFFLSSIVFLGNILGILIGLRVVVLGAAIVSFIAMLVTAFAPNVIIVLIFMGVISGEWK